jgi:Flp pilus assembly protein TadG
MTVSHREACDDGAVAVEMALVSPLLALLLLGICDFGTLLVNAMEVEHATEAAASYAYNQFLVAGAAPPLAQLQATVEAQSLPLALTIGVDPARPGLTWTGCPTGVSVETSAGGTCAAGAGTYLSVVGSAPVQTRLGAWTGFPTTLAAKRLVRLQ